MRELATLDSAVVVGTAWEAAQGEDRAIVWLENRHDGREVWMWEFYSPRFAARKEGQASGCALAVEACQSHFKGPRKPRFVRAEADV